MLGSIFFVLGLGEGVVGEVYDFFLFILFVFVKVKMCVLFNSLKK